MATILGKQEDSKMLPTRRCVRWVDIALLALGVIAFLARPAPAIAGTQMAADVVSSGGGESQSSLIVLSDTFGQGPIGPRAEGGGISLLDGFWAAAGLPVKSDTLPPAAIAFFTAGPGDEKVMLRWTNPGDADFAKAVIRYSTVGYPGTPIGGNPVENGSCGACPNEAASVDSFLHTGLVNQTQYFYTAFAFDSSANYSSGVIASAVPFDEDPPPSVTQLGAEAGDTTVVLRWTNPDDADFDHTLIRYSTSGYVSDPEQGLAVENGADGEFPGAAASVDSFVHTGLENGQVYYYTAFAGDEVPNYASGVNVSAEPADEVAPPEVVAFGATAGDTTVVLRWTNPDDTDFDHTLIRYSTTGYPSGPGEGLPVENGADGEFPGAPASMDSFPHTGLDNGTTYYYAAFAGDEVPNYAEPVMTSSAPVDTVPPGPVTGFVAVALEDGTVKLRWTNAGDTDVRGAHIRYSDDTYPAHAADKNYVDNGAGGMFEGAPAAVDSFIQTDLTVGNEYYYSVFAYDEEENYSAGETASATPYDEVAPTFDISVFQNPYLTKHLDVFVIPAESIFDTSLIVVIGTSDTLEMEVTDSGEGVYRGDYDLYTTGAVFIRSSGRDVNGNWGSTERSFTSTSVLAASGGVARSLDGLCEASISAAAVTGDMYVLVFETVDDDGEMVYRLSPSVPLEDYVGVSISFGDRFVAPEHLCIARVEDGKLIPLESYVVQGEGRIVTHVDRLGSFRLLWRPDIETPVYGAGGVAVYQNVPNPFVGTTTIGFEMPRRGRVKVDIVSVDGRIIRSLFDDSVLPGKHSVDWDGRDSGGDLVASGVYLYRVRSDSSVITKKMILLR